MSTSPSSTARPATIPVLSVPNVPANSVLLMHDREAAQAVPRGRLDLVADVETGLVYNRAFDASLTEYNEEYESTQSYSPTFNAFHRRLARALGERHRLRGKTVLEIGCGNGEFLRLLVEECGVTAVGFDPAFNEERAGVLPDGVTVVPELFTEETDTRGADFIACKMTLEHIPDPASFLSMVRRAIGERSDTVVFVQVPEAQQLYREGAFWDFYYEHCSYFSPGALARVFRRAGFEVLKLWTEYDDQYLMIEARPAVPGTTRQSPLETEEPLDALLQFVEQFAVEATAKLEAWKRLFQRAGERGKQVVIWGGSSKTVGFVTALGLEEGTTVVDVNPNKHDTFLPGSGLRVVGPSRLPSIRPDVVLVTNPVYRAEIERDLQDQGLDPRIWTLHDDPQHLSVG